MAEVEQPEFRLGPDPNVTYPLQVQYCGNCSLPLEVILFYFFFFFNKYIDKYLFFI